MPEIFHLNLIFHTVAGHGVSGCPRRSGKLPDSSKRQADATGSSRRLNTAKFLSHRAIVRRGHPPCPPPPPPSLPHHHPLPPPPTTSTTSTTTTTAATTTQATSTSIWSDPGFVAVFAILMSLLGLLLIAGIWYLCTRSGSSFGNMFGPRYEKPPTRVRPVREYEEVHSRDNLGMSDSHKTKEPRTISELP
ncbi:hypothetical protein C0Q70_07204 [Pomacea canaliculata]|uniref:Uncharacterized protein n=1 Tax=Pomacea canaliculata TaxID=400727 RepID=A0A2T7PED8_POMCA|nr:hypothetical protein C0Q70_07204 [Pomacea canaliculata]